MEKIHNYIMGNWVYGQGPGQPLFHAVTGEQIGTASTRGLDFGAILDYGRKTGNPALRKMTFQQRGLMLKALALHLFDKKDQFYPLSYRTGATRADSWIDIEGGIGNLFSNASLRRKLPDEPYLLDGDPIGLGKMGSFGAQHLLIPKEGVAVHINAFNFPVWGMLEKIAVNLLAGVPAIVKPATITSYLTEAVVREIIASGILPEGALQLICGSGSGLLDQVHSQDVVTFTGSASTGLMLKSTPQILRENVPFNLEADSLNCIVLGEDVTPEMPEWDLFLKEIRKEMVAKAGQKCTAIRRIFVPENKLDPVLKDLTKLLSKIPVGNPEVPEVRMGALAGNSQRSEVRERVEALMATSRMVYGSLDNPEVLGADSGKGAFLSPILLLNENPLTAEEPHTIEAFGPVATVMPYKTAEEAITLSKMGKGSLCTTVVTTLPSFARTYVMEAGTYHGRILLLNQECAKENTGHGSPLPTLVHGGPGRAGGGEEMGGLRGIRHYMQRLAVQGGPTLLTEVTRVYQPGGAGKETAVHPFKKYFEELRIADQITTPSRRVTSRDIEEFADLSGDHFYAHLSDTDFSDTMFEGQVAHGYLLMSLAAGLFVDSYEKNPVLLNYGIDELRFTKPVYPGQEIHVRFTCKEKISQELKDPNPEVPFKKGSDIPKGIVKWYVEILDDSEEPLIGVATILTMVRKKSVN
ncbi:MAG: phenylacetic acid degradation bifunctional protein PaaZ [Bacteroidota bacterium]|nr:phenylacetic acid degradation bifunctional protein PaaZ [Bacteroidota bacterium]